MTQNVWSYRTDLSNDLKRQDQLVGYDVEALDGSIGKIDKASTETDRYYLVVDTGFWIFGKKRLIPAGVVSTRRPRRPQGVCRDEQGADQEPRPTTTSP